MRALNCKASRYAIEQAELNSQLSTEVLVHVRGCHDCRKFYEERLKLRELLASLTTVEAPPNFDFQLRARLAKLNTNRSSFSTPRNLRVSTVSLALLMLILGIGYGVHTFSDRDTQVASTAPAEVEFSDEKLGQAVVHSPLESLEAVPPAAESERTALASQRRNETRRVRADRVRTSTVVRDFANTAAPVFRKDESLASANDISVFQIGASYQSLNVSLDDGSGEPKTISLPSVSFGSQRVFTSSGVSTPAASRGVW